MRERERERERERRAESVIFSRQRVSEKGKQRKR